MLWHSSLTLKNIIDLERVQKSAVRIIIGQKYDSYSDTLKSLKIETLFERRERLCLRFANKSLSVGNFKHLFPLYEKQHSMMTRDSKKYDVCKSSSKRYKISTIPHLQRLMNKQAQLKILKIQKIKIKIINTLSPVTLASSEDI